MTRTVSKSYLCPVAVLPSLTTFAIMDKIAELNPGLYKIVKRDNKQTSRRAHLLRVQGHGQKRRYFLDQDQIGELAIKMEGANWEDYEVIKKYDFPPEVFNNTIILTFQDKDRHEFSFTVRSTWTLRAIFETFDWLKDPFQFNKSRSRIVNEITGGHVTAGVFNHPKRTKNSGGSDWSKRSFPDDNTKT